MSCLVNVIKCKVKKTKNFSANSIINIANVSRQKHKKKKERKAKSTEKQKNTWLPKGKNRR